MVKRVLFLCLFLGSCLPSFADQSSQSKYERAELRSGFGYIDCTGHFVIPPSFKCASSFSEGLAQVTRFGRPSDFATQRKNFMERGGFINKTGAYEIRPKYSCGGAYFKNGKTLVSDGAGNSTLIDKSGRTIASFKNSTQEFLLDSGHVLLKKWIYKGLADGRGKILLEPKCDEIFPFFEGFAVVHVNGKLSGPDLNNGTTFAACGPPGISQSKAELIDRFGRIVIPPNFDELRPLSANYVFFKRANKWGIISIKGDVIKEPVFDDVDRHVPVQRGFETYHYYDENNCLPADNKAIVRIVKGFYYVDERGRHLFDRTFADAYPFKEGLALVGSRSTPISDHVLYGFIDQKGKFVIEPSFDFAKPFCAGFATVLRNDKWGVIDKAGHVIFPPNFDQISNFENGVAVGRRNTKWSILNANGTEIKLPSIQDVYGFSEGLAVAQTAEVTFWAVERGSQRDIERKPTREDLEYMGEYFGRDDVGTWKMAKRKVTADGTVENERLKPDFAHLTIE